MSAIDVKEIVYHCQCRRFVEGLPSSSCTCPECGRKHLPTEDGGSVIIPVTREYTPGNAVKEVLTGMSREVVSG